MKYSNLKNGNQQGKRGSRLDIMKRAFRILEYLRVNTDKKNPTSQEKLSESNEIAKYIPAPKTFNEFMHELTDILNSDEGGVKSPAKWRLVYKKFEKIYGNKSENVEEEESNSVTGIYYSHIFSDDELTAIINSLRTSKFVTKDAAEKIIGKLKDELASKYYKEPPYKVNADEFTDRPEMVENLVKIQEAIGCKNKITFTFQYYNEAGNPEPNKSKRHTVSPYYIVANGGRFYLLGGYNNGKMCVYRIDLMKDIHISKNGEYIKSLSQDKIRGLPKNNEELKEFKTTHPYMSFDTETIKVKLKALKTSRTDRGKRLTHLIDTFGEVDEHKPLDDGTYEVECTEFDILMFALRECDDFEVVGPASIREKIKEKIREIGKRYGI